MNKTNHIILNKDRMYCYLWHEYGRAEECKFGERWVPAGTDPMTECRIRIRESVAVRKDLYDEGEIIVDAIWDVSEFAKSQCPKKFKQHGKVDDFIRKIVGFRKGTTGEIHTLDATTMAIKVNQILIKVGQPLPIAGLSQNQYDAASNVLEAINNNKRTIVAELCARFGKTIWSGALVRETNAELTIVASYVLTSFASFMKDLTSFDQFKNLRLIEAGESDWELMVKSGLERGHQVVVFLSMCSGQRRQDKIDYLFGPKLKKYSRLLIVDEADFGVHQAKQSKPLIDARHKNDTVILMTGTNADKAASIWPVDHYLSVTYPELLIEKNKSRIKSC